MSSLHLLALFGILLLGTGPVSGGAVGNRKETNVTVVEIGNKDLRCYRCNSDTDPSCGTSFNKTAAEIQNCSEIFNSTKLYSNMTTPFDVTHMSYVCTKEIFDSSRTERRCGFTNIDNTDYCVMAKNIVKSIHNVFIAIENKFLSSDKSPVDDVDFKCSTCDTDLCNDY